MTMVPSEPVIAHIRSLGMNSAELSTRSGVPQSTIRGAVSYPQMKKTTADRLLAVQPVVTHAPAVTPEGRVACPCGFRSQRFGTIGLAKARAREHRDTGR